MKTNSKLFILATATALAACTKENELSIFPVAAQVTANVSSPKARAVNNQWNADKIGVMVVNTFESETTMSNKYKNVGYKTTSTGISADFVPITTGEGIFFEDTSKEFTFAAYAPYEPRASTSALPGNNGTITINTDNQPTVTEQENIDYLYATGAKASKATPIISFTNNTATGGSDCSFKHKMTRLILKVQVSSTDGFTKYPSVLKYANYKLGGLIHKGTFNILTGTATATGTAVNDWILRKCIYTKPNVITIDNKVVASYDENTDAMTLTMILLPQTLTDYLNFEISPDDGQSQTYSNKNLIKPALEAGYSYTYTITVRKTGLTVSGSTIEDWNDGGSHSGDAKMQ